MKNLAFLVFLTLTTFNVFADGNNDTPEITDSWARATPPGASTSAIYMTISNHTNGALKLIGVNSTTTERIEIHNTTEQDGMMQMRQLDSIEIAQHKSVELKPHGKHLMLFDLKAPLEDGTQLSVELIFDNGKTLVVEVPVKKQLGSEGDSDMMSHKHKDH